MQQEQILLRSDHFHLFAGLGPIVEGYVIIAPHRCDVSRGGFRTMAEVPPELLDELVFLRGIVTRFYLEVYEFEGCLCFEHGRAGTCGVGDTPHCYHAHLCCFPDSSPIWSDVRVARRHIQRIKGFGDLGPVAGASPFLLVQNLRIDHRFLPHRAQRQSWQSHVLVLDTETQIPRQYLRRLLAERAGRPDLWDWAAAPCVPKVRSLCTRFREWLIGKSELPVRWNRTNTPCLNFLEAVRACNSAAYDLIARRFDRQWSRPKSSMRKIMTDFAKLIGRFKGRHERGKRGRNLRLLDAGCGPGIHLNVFRDKGFSCVGVDRSKAMLAVAADKLAGGKPVSARPSLELWHEDAFDLKSFEPESFDAIWYCALMVHLPRRFAKATIDTLHRILRPEGVLYLSAQTGGDAAFRRDRRFFVYYTRPELESKFQAAGFEVLKRWHARTDESTCGDRHTKYWINYFVTKPVKQRKKTQPPCE